MTEADSQPILYATFPRRLLGFCVDVAFWFLVVIPLTAAVGSVVPYGLFDRIIYLVLAGFLLYEPVLVSLTGGTLGHHLLNLRVSRGPDGRKLGFVRALLRFVLKEGLSLFSFLFMAFSRRNQAFHDNLTGSYVHLKDPEKARPGDFVLEIRGRSPELGVSRVRRLMAVIGYSLAATLLWVFVPWPMISDVCRDTGPCTPNEQVMTVVMGLAWFGALMVLLIVGWRGLLPGARAEKAP